MNHERKTLNEWIKTYKFIGIKSTNFMEKIKFKKDYGIFVKEGEKYDDGFVSLRNYIKNNIDNNPLDDCHNIYFFGTFEACQEYEEFHTLLNYDNDINFTYNQFLIDAEHRALNLDGEFVPFNLFVRYSPRYYGKYGKEGQVFLRPNSGMKTLHSGLVDIQKNLPDLIKYQKFNTNSDELVYISTPKSINLECRFFIFNDEIVAHSTYLINGECIAMENVPPESINYVNNYLKVVKKPGKAYVLDVALSEGNYKLIETNGYFTSALYDCNPEKIVQPLIQEINGIQQ